MESPATGKFKPTSGSNVYQIGGVPVEFPYKPYGTQLAFMGRVISTLDQAQRGGRCDALLESPTGTGKTLSLLCAAIAWQRSYASRYGPGGRQQSPATPRPTPDPLANGGGFIPEEEYTAPGNAEKGASTPTNARARRKQIRPVIYYASRTHTQITQVIRELRKTSYRVPMAILASRKHYCINKHVCSKENLDEECKTLLKDENIGCMEYKNMHKVKGHSLLQAGGALEAHDIEDLVKVGQTVRGCPYFAAQCMAAEADLVFCPYSYIINPVIRKMMDIDIKGAILILDEAHNVEDMARDAGSLDVDEETLSALRYELEELCVDENTTMTYQPLCDMIEGIISWIQLKKDSLQKRDFERYCTCWTGDKAIKELQVAGISQQHFQILKGCATKAIKVSLDAESNELCLSGMSTLTLEGLFSSLSFFFSDNGGHALDYQLALQRYVKRDSQGSSGGWKQSVSLWCLHPAVVFKEMADLSLSVILTSGTLSPMGSFASELGVKFETSLEAPHVIDADSQLWAAIISNGPGNCQLNASYKTSDGFAFQDSLGMSLEAICKTVPGGVLIFFPSYKLLEKLQNRWCHTGQWSRLNVQKSVYVEPRSKNEDFETILKNYYSSIKGIKKVIPGRPKGRKRDSNNPSLQSSTSSSKEGAAFLAVCRGKVSEGIDFSDQNARAVVIVGIPFPNKNDIQVTLKKNYNDTFKSSKSLLSGSEWYCHQAFRALNQAAGRCIRHRLDYGAIILIDERFKEERNVAYISRWIKKSIKQFDTFDTSLESLRAFFQEKEKLEQNKGTSKNESPLSGVDLKNLPSLNESTLFRWTTASKVPKSNKCSRKAVKRSDASRKKTGEITQLNNGDTTPTTVLLSNVKSSEAEQPLVTTESLSTLDFAERTTQSNLFSWKTTKRSGPWKKTGKTGQRNYMDSTSTTIPLSDATSDEAEQPMTTTQSLLADDFVERTTRSNLFGICTTPSNCIEEQKVPTNVTKIRGLLDMQIVSEVTCCPQAVQSHYLEPETTCQASSIADSTETNMQEHCNIIGSTPERKNVQEQNSSSEPALCLSVNSHKHKRKKLTSPDAIASAQNLNTMLESDPLCPFNGGQRAELMLDSNSDSNLQKLPTETATRKLFIHCMICRSPLGLQENQYLVSCTLTSTSKDCVAFLLNNGPFSMYSPFSSSSTNQFLTPVAISDQASVTQFLLKNLAARGIPQQDVWSSVDGCVFRTLFCPFCPKPGTFLGLEIKAVDSSNEYLKEKVLFYVDRLYITDEQGPEKQGSLPGHMDKCHDKPPIPIESFAYHSPKAYRTNSKLKLPRGHSA